MTGARVSRAWLALREPADAAARDAELVNRLRGCLPAGSPLVVHDLACGTGSMLRWLAPRLPAPQHWVCHDLDADLLAAVTDAAAPHADDGSPVTVEVRHHDVTRLPPGECDGAALITTSALLDLLTADELQRLVATCVEASCPVLLTLSVVGRVELWPPHPLDSALGAAFNAHQRRVRDGRRLLGPDAADSAAGAFRARGHDVLVRSSPWRLGAAERDLTAQWLSGWVGAACEQRPDLAAAACEYRRWRLADARAGRLRVLVHHHDLLTRPRGAR